MIVDVRPERVCVNKCDQTAVGSTVHACHLDKRDEAGNVVGKGAFLGFGVLLDSGHLVYAQPEQLEVIPA